MDPEATKTNIHFTVYDLLYAFIGMLNGDNTKPRNLELVVLPSKSASESVLLPPITSSSAPKTSLFTLMTSK